jgi:hypothetical protein
MGSPAAAVGIETAGIHSEESVGAPSVVAVGGAQEITGVGAIPTAEVVGLPALALILELLGISSAEAVGSPTVSCITEPTVASSGLANAPPIPLFRTRAKALAMLARIPKEHRDHFWYLDMK